MPSKIPISDTVLDNCVSNNKVAVADSSVVTAVGNIPQFNGVTTNTVLTAVENQRTNYLCTAPPVVTTAMQTLSTGAGTGTAMTVTGYKMAALQVTTTATTVTLDFEASVDGTNFMTGIDVTDATGVDYSGSISQTGAGTWVYQFMCAGVAAIQCNITANAATGGTSVTVTARATV